jgi:topoisomerase-4 subunit B
MALPQQNYTAADIEVLEGLEPVRRRPGMYIGGTDSTALHHLVSEVLDNSMDEAVAGHANKIWITIKADNTVVVRDNGRGIPTDPHPKYPHKSALEVILTTLHSGGKFSDKSYATSGGLHGVGISVVNALSSSMAVEVARDGKVWEQTFARGTPTSILEEVGETRNKRGTTVTFTPDDTIFEDCAFIPEKLRQMVRSKAYLYRGVTINWRDETEEEVQEETFHYPEGLADFLKDKIGDAPCITNTFFTGMHTIPDGDKEFKVEWALAWPFRENGKMQTYANTVPTPQGGTHETGMRAALLKSLRQYAEMRGKKGASITADDIQSGAWILLSVFLADPQFQGQTKDKLTTTAASRLTESALKDAFDLWLSADPDSADALMNMAIDRAEERAKRKKEKEVKRKTAVSRRVRLPGKLSDCAQGDANDTEIFIVEGDSAGGSAKQARDRQTQAILPLRGKILNVANATKDKMMQNKELQDLTQALGCGLGKDCKPENLRYERVVIMTDADVDGAHIAALLLTFFFQQMPEIVMEGHVYLALPPLYKMNYGGTTVFALDDEEKEKHLETTFKGKKNVEIGRFKGLGEMPAAQLKETTMDMKKRKLLRISIDSLAETDTIVRKLMGKNPEDRLDFIKVHAQEVSQQLDI